jgi:hypothetical protein
MTNRFTIVAEPGLLGAASALIPLETVSQVDASLMRTFEQGFDSEQL